VTGKNLNVINDMGVAGNAYIEGSLNVSGGLRTNGDISVVEGSVYIDGEVNVSSVNINNKNIIPTLSSNTSLSPYVSVSSSSGNAFEAFDGDSITRWMSDAVYRSYLDGTYSTSSTKTTTYTGGTVNGEYIQISFNELIYTDGFGIVFNEINNNIISNSLGPPRGIKIFAKKNTSDSFTLIHDRNTDSSITDSMWSSGVFFQITNPDYYSVYRFVITSAYQSFGTDTRVSISELKLIRNGNLYIEGDTIELRKGLLSKDVNAGVIGYQKFSNSLDIVGAGTTVDTRSVKIYDNLIVQSNAYKPAGGSWIDSSDERIKEDIQDADLSICYNNVKNLKLKYYKYKDEYIKPEQRRNDSHVLGFIAQEVKQLLPKSVPVQEQTFKYTDENGEEKEEVIENFHYLDKDQIIMTLYGTVQYLQGTVGNLQQELQIVKQHLQLESTQVDPTSVESSI
jgi:hypothetical protein